MGVPSMAQAQLALVALPSANCSLLFASRWFAWLTIRRCNAAKRFKAMTWRCDGDAMRCDATPAKRCRAKQNDWMKRDALQCFAIRDDALFCAVLRCAAMR